MRKIEMLMRDAIAHGRCFKRDNTEVQINDLGSEVRAHIYLHGNHIASVDLFKVPLELGSYQGFGDALHVNMDTLRRWPTVTTRSRLSALGANVYQRKGVIYLNSEEVCYAQR